MATTADSEWSYGSNIKVVVRCRPMNDREIKASEDVVTILDNKLVSLADPGHFADNYMRRARLKSRQFAFDTAWGADSTNRQVYASTTRHLIDGILAGENATCFAYGQTGSGKTFSMLGSVDNPGIMVLTLTDLYTKIEAMRAGGSEVSATCSYLEIYNENIRDLSVAAASIDEAEWLDLREDPLRGPCAAGVVEHEVESVEHVMTLLADGNRRRTQEPTAANKESSRSHAVLQILVQVKADRFATQVSLGKLSLIDLAGSERAANTQNRGLRLIEGANINRSLLALGNCITALVQSKGSFVPYRDSKLTRLLKDSLGGSTKTIMLGCIGPAASSFEESVNTLKYCDRAKRIRVPATARNVQSVSYQLSEYEALLSGLRGEVAALKTRLASIAPSASGAAARPLSGVGGASLGGYGPGSRRASATAEAISMIMQAGVAGSGGDGFEVQTAAGERTLIGRVAGYGGSTASLTPLKAADPPPDSEVAAAIERVAQTPAESTQLHVLQLQAAAAADAEASERIRSLRAALVGNFQDRMQLRRSLAELAARNVENAVLIGKQQVTLARHGEPLVVVSEEPAVGEVAASAVEELGTGDGTAIHDGNAAVEAARQEIAALQRSVGANGRVKADLHARLSANEEEGAALRDELDHLGTTDDRRELLALEYRVCLLELEKVELEQAQLLFEKMMVQREGEMRRLRRAVRAKDRLIAHLLRTVEAAGAVASVDARLLEASNSASAQLRSVLGAGAFGAAFGALQSSGLGGATARRGGSGEPADSEDCEGDEDDDEGSYDTSVGQHFAAPTVASFGVQVQ